MRSREPWRLPAGQSRAVPFLQAAVLFAALCIFARSAALVLAAFLAAPVPAAQTLLHLGQQAVESRAAAASAESVPEDVSAPSPAQEADVPVQTGVEQYFVALQPDEARPADAGTVTEQQFGQGSGEKYIPCGAGSIKNNTRQTAADIAAEVAQPLPFAIEKDSAALVLAAFLAAPVPAAQTLLHLGQQAVRAALRHLRKACRRTCPRPLRRRKLTSRCRPGWSSILWRCSRTKPAPPMQVR